MQNVHPKIFVSIISYCDKNWLAQIEQLMGSASRPHRLHFGVVEYVDSADDSQEELIPTEWRNNTRVYTVSKKIATSLREARRLCLSKLYNEEEFVMFSKSVIMERGWDDKLVSYITEKSVISMHLSSDNAPVFPCIHVNSDISYKTLTVLQDRAVPSLLWLSDFSFSTVTAANTLLEFSDPFQVTAALHALGFHVFIPGNTIAKRATYPRGIKERIVSNSTSPEAIEFKKEIGVGATRTTAYAQLGITPKAAPDEQISKYGSVVAVRVAAQSIDAKP
jgi:hypothetical protein